MVNLQFAIYVLRDIQKTDKMHLTACSFLAGTKRVKYDEKQKMKDLHKIVCYKGAFRPNKTKGGTLKKMYISCTLIQAVKTGFQPFIGQSDQLHHILSNERSE